MNYYELYYFSNTGCFTMTTAFKKSMKNAIIGPKISPIIDPCGTPYFIFSDPVLIVKLYSIV